VQSALQPMGQQHPSKGLKETEQTDKEGWLCSSDCSRALGTSYAKKNAALVAYYSPFT